MRLFSSSSSAAKEQKKGTKSRVYLYLNVYDLTPVNNYLYWFGLGIFHSGIEGSDSIFYILILYLFLECPNSNIILSEYFTVDYFGFCCKGREDRSLLILLT